MAIVVECVILKVKSLQILSLIWPWEIIIKFITLLENRSSVVTTVRSTFPLDFFHACEELARPPYFPEGHSYRIQVALHLLLYDVWAATPTAFGYISLLDFDVL